MVRALEKIQSLPEELLDKPSVFYNIIADKNYEWSRNGGIMAEVPHYDGAPNYDKATLQYNYMSREI